MRMLVFTPQGATTETLLQGDTINENRGSSRIQALLGLGVIGGLGVSGGVCIDAARQWRKENATPRESKGAAPAKNHAHVKPCSHTCTSHTHQPHLHA